MIQNSDLQKKRVIVHVGFMKAGSSSLQKALGESRKINYLGTPFKSLQSNHFFRIELCNANELIFNKEALKKVCLDHASAHPERPIVISSEELLDQERFIVPFTTRMTRLSDAFGCPIEIVIIFREQWSFLRSYYSDLVKGGLCLNFNDYLKTMLLRGEKSILGYLNYGKLIDLANSVSSKVHYFFLEDMSDKICQARLLSAFGADDVTDLPMMHKANYNILSQILNKNQTSPFFSGAGYESDFHDSRRLYRMGVMKVDMGADFVSRIQENKSKFLSNVSAINSEQINRIELGTENLFRADEDLVSFINNIVGKWNKSLFEKTSRDLRCLGYISD